MKRTSMKLMVFALGALLLLSMAPQALPNFTQGVEYQEIGNLDDSIDESLLNLNLNGDFNLTNDYQQFWEPNNIQGSSRAVAVSESNNFMATSGGWMNDAELHIYRWFEPTLEYVHVWESGDGEFGGDITDLEFMDSDSNGRLEIVAGCQDGMIYIYEAMGIEDDTFSELEECNIFVQVWTSGFIMDQQVWDIELNDIDHDGQTEIIAANWDHKVWVFDYIDHSSWPYCQEEHWIHFEPVWNSGDVISDRVNSVVIGDTDRDMKSEIIAGSQDGKVYIFEEKPCLHHDYNLIWTSGDAIWRPINAIAYSENFDSDVFGEFAVSAYGQGVYVFHYDWETEDYYVKKLNREPELWEKGATVLTPPVYTGYEVDPYVDRKDYGWGDQGISEFGTIPYPWSTPEIGGASALGGPPDLEVTDFGATEQLGPLFTWDYEEGAAPGEIQFPYGMAVAPDGSVFVAEYLNDRITKLDAEGNFVLTIGVSGNETGELNGPIGVEVDEDGMLYVADALNSRIQKFTPEGDFIASWGENGSAVGQFYYPYDLEVGPTGELFVLDTGNERIIVMDRYNGTIYDEIVGAGSTELTTPVGISIGPLGNIYVTDTGNSRVIVFKRNGAYVDQWGSTGVGDGQFSSPSFSTITADGMLYVSDSNNHRVQKFTLDGLYVSQFGSPGTGPGQFAGSMGIDFDHRGLVKVVDVGNERIHTFGVLDYYLEDIIGTNYGPDGGLAYPFDVGQDPDGNIYVADYSGGVIVKYAEDGTYLMNWSLPGGGNPLVVHVDDNGEIFLSDYTGDRIHVTDYEGNLIRAFGSPGSNPGEFDDIYDMNTYGNLLFTTEYGNDRVQVFDKNGTFLYTWGSAGSGDGQFLDAYGIDFGPDGMVYVADYGNNRIQRFYLNGTYDFEFAVPGDQPQGLAFDNDGLLHCAQGTDGIRTFTIDGTEVGHTSYDKFYNYKESFEWGTLHMMTLANDGDLLVTSTVLSRVVKVSFDLGLDEISEAVVDFGEYEEFTGDATPAFDVIVYMPLYNPDRVGFEISISQDGLKFVRIPFNHTVAYNNGGKYELRCDVDYTLRTMGWTNARYMRIGVKAGLSVGIDAVEVVVDRPIESTTCMIAGKITYPLLWGDYDTIIMGTVDGQILAYDIGYEDTYGLYTIFESYSDTPKFTLDSTIRDIVQLDGRGRMPTWRGAGVLLAGADVTGVNFERFSSYALFDPDWDGDLDIAAIVQTTGFPLLLYYENQGDDDSPVYVRDVGFFDTNVAVGNLETLALVTNASIAVADVTGNGYDDIILTWNFANVLNEIRFLERTGAPMVWTLWDTTTTNSEFFWVRPVVEGSDVIPRFSFHDMDYDGDLDLTVGCEDLYYFIQDSSDTQSYFSFNRRDYYYEDINTDQIDDMVFGKVGFHDYDFDMTVDITVSHGWENFSYYGADPEASMLTYYENQGTQLNPEWQKNRRIYEPDLRGTPLNPERGTVEPQMLDFNDDDVLDIVLMRELDIFRMEARLDHDSFLVTSNPYLHMIEVEKVGTDLGFEIHDSWDNSEKFDDWSLTVEIADTDQDGLNEVIVGSMDQNIYTFEQVANNTYRRAWRSPDFYSLRSDGKNTHTFWDDVESMAVGDQDLDGKQEILVVAGVEVFVFENVANDVYELVWKAYWLDWGIPMGQVTHYVPPNVHNLDVVGVDTDLDKDGKPEIIVGGENLILVYENVGDNNYTAVWGAEFNSHEGGEPHIKAVHTGDFDNDGTRDIAVVGSDYKFDMFGNIENEDGWLHIFENKDDTDNYYETKYNYVDYNKGAHCIDVADHDLDAQDELYVGFDWGIQVFIPNAVDSYDDVQTIPTVNATYAIHVGNTDGDSWFELIAGIGPYLAVFEQNDTYARSAHEYDMVWNTTELRDDITDIAIGDTDHDSILEIVATAARGNVYAFEWRPNVTAEAEAPLLAEFSLSYEGDDSAGSLVMFVTVQMGTEHIKRRFYLN